MQAKWEMDNKDAMMITVKAQCDAVSSAASSIKGERFAAWRCAESLHSSCLQPCYRSFQCIQHLPFDYGHHLTMDTIWLRTPFDSGRLDCVTVGAEALCFLDAMRSDSLQSMSMESKHSTMLDAVQQVAQLSR